ncbi:hypothetical protein [Elioraea tepidiphila]|uniref:hypothetical protein n=1 Tax=Elioraea tepidiphila TaxID=457934 RepID=UPI00035E9C6A|nr:hypothetical protein [Elioraea tepidiphila]
MAVIASDTFAGLGDGVSIAGRTLDNGDGGSGTRTWADINSSNMVGNGAGQIRGTNNYRNNRVQVTGLGTHRLRTRFTFNGSYSNICLTTLCTNGTDNGTTSAIYAVLGSSGTSLQVREGVNQNWSAGTNRATKTITAPATSGYYWLELTIEGLLVTARVRNDDLSLYDEVSHTFGALPSGQFCGLGFALSGNAALFDNFVVDDMAAGGGDPPPSTPPRARAMWV